MNTWLLILTLHSSAGGVAIEHINLNSREACFAVGEAWKKREKRAFGSANFLCFESNPASDGDE